MTDPIFMAYYTRATPYEQEARRLIDSAKDFGITIHLHAIDSRGSWQKNTQAKPSIIRRMMEDYPGRPLVYLDVDAKILKRPSLFLDGELTNVDLAAARHDGHTLLSGTLWLGGGPGCIALVDRWIELCAKYPERFPAGVHPRFPRGGDAWDQRMLEVAMSQMVLPPIRFVELPPEYTFMHDLSREIHPKLEPVILHMLVSRKYRDGPEAIK